MAFSALNRLGFIGTGTITEAIVQGIVASDAETPDIAVSPRSVGTAARLAALSAKVSVPPDNQAVVDAADTVFLAVRPDVAEAVTRPLQFRAGQRVISLIATIDHATLQNWIGVPVSIVRAVPLPFVATRSGVTVVFPPNQAVESLFAELGTAVACNSIEEFDVLATTSALMGLYFGIMEHVVGWAHQKGLPPTSARTYLSSLFASLGTVASNTPTRSLEELRHEYSTKGGLNEQMHAQFQQAGGAAALTAALESVLGRVRHR
ncbi:pyrroline-5-carboxylate reductase [Pararhizobium capsulatum DSM 1112]|uniref:Pyrroline-5-carboxylate reductase n=1 Tax=Pararhizobium capsulatum DSM 1112 TaxID=1121113 RepID=A0ABU0BK74_9HYPH|nr:pyrroline-5-carboxylate reductase [Pararhizobium capsulatum]MDQ0318293.1 pyrroline-5-carboxylate reductase [Pararhizobium capsulatum DSM 1112]